MSESRRREGLMLSHRQRRIIAGAAGLLLAVGGISLLGSCRPNATNIPNLAGPSELAISILMSADPDVLVADGVSTSAIGINIRDRNGQPINNLKCVFALTGPGTIDHLYATTNGAGMASVTYTAPSSSGSGSASVQVRPIGLDFNGADYRSVSIELRGAQ